MIACLPAPEAPNRGWPPRTEPRVASPDVAEPLGSRFAKLWTASTASALGSGLATIAAPLYVAAHTRSPLIVSATAGAAWLPWLLFALPGGVLVDRG
jgi:Transmembrane secretion effector